VLFILMFIRFICFICMRCLSLYWLVVHVSLLAPFFKKFIKKLYPLQVRLLWTNETTLIIWLRDGLQVNTGLSVSNRFCFVFILLVFYRLVLCHTYLLGYVISLSHLSSTLMVQTVFVSWIEIKLLGMLVPEVWFLWIKLI